MNKKVLFITGGYPEPERQNNFVFSHELVKSLKDNEIDVSVVNLKSSRVSKLTKEVYDGIPVYRCNMQIRRSNPVQYLKNRYDLTRQLRKMILNYDNVIFSFLYPSYLSLLPIFKKKNKLLISHGGDAMLRWEKPIKKYIKKQVLASMDEYFAVSDATAIYLEHFVPKKKVPHIHVLYNGINRGKFKNCRKREEIRHSLGLPEKKFVLLTVCNLVSRKGVDTLLKSDHLLKEAGVDFTHIIVGRGPEETGLKEMVNNLNLIENVQFIPYIEKDQDLAELFIASDLFVMMSRTEHEKCAMEGFGIVYAEAQFAGIPVIAGKSGGVASAVRDSFTGYLIDPSRSDAAILVKDKILELSQDQVKYKEFSSNAKRFVRESLDWQYYVRSLKEYLI
jgi:phosphatidyl-myo-inositol dimannoside synthase